MCNRDDSSRWWLVALFALLALFVARTARADEPSVQYAPPSQSAPEPLPPSASLTPSEAWQLLIEDWYSFAPLWASLTDQSQALGIGISELPGALKTTRESLASLQVSYQVEVGARLKAERARNSWIAIAIALGSIAAGEAIAITIQRLAQP